MNVLEPDATMPLFLRRFLETTTDEEAAPATNDGDDEYSHYDTYVVDDDDSEDYLVPMWTVMLLVILGSSLLVMCVVYVSYQHEWCTTSTVVASNGGGGGGDANGMEQAAASADHELPVKTFNDSTAFDRLPHETLADLQQPISSVSTARSSSGSSSTQQSSPPPGSPSRYFMEMAMTPRCVLCSQHYKVGEPVTHSSNPNCHHEYHETCLKKHWAKNQQQQSDTQACPVCKQVYLMAAERAPSKHFSSHHLEIDNNMTPTNHDNDNHDNSVSPF